ncbi:MAG: thioesterase family protein [Planctomycetota bacterium]
MFEVPQVIRLPFTDAAGVVFFARYFDLAHLAFEELFDHLGHPVPAELWRAEVGYPLVRSEAEYRRPLALGDRVAVQIEAERVGRTSFTLRHRFVHREHGEVAVVRLTHVAIHVPTRTPVPLPEDLTEALRTHLAE